MAKKKGGRAAKDPCKAKLALLSQVVASFKPQKIGGTYIKEDLEELQKQIAYQQKPVLELIKAQAVVDGDRFKRSDGDRKEAGEKFSAWLSKNAPDCKLGDAFEFKWDGLEEGSGIVAKRALKRHEKFIEIPRDVMITSAQASQSPVGAVLMKDPTFARMPNLMLAVHVMFESLNPSSFHKSYLDALPRHFTLPLFYTTEELSLLEGSPAHYDALKIQKQTLRQYILTTKLLKGRPTVMLKLPKFTYRDFRWAVGVVMTRQNRIPSKESSSQSVLALIPGWDFCNFRDGELTTQYNDEVHASESFTMDDIKEGKQIYIYYGKRPNSKLFLFSGFVADDNKEDYVEVVFSHEDSDSSVSKIRKLLLQNRRLTSMIQPFRITSATGAPSDICMTWLRICRCNKEEAATVLKAKTAVISKLSDRNEAEAVALLHEVVKRTLAKYKTTLEEDEKRLKDDKSLSANARVAIRLRMKEKAALQKCLLFKGAGDSKAGEKKAD
eukprot:jgi/Bigna1/89596/estExt_fgenesh1_pg.C_520051